MAKADRVMRTYSRDGTDSRIIISAQRLNGLIRHKAEGDGEGFLEMLTAIKGADTIADVRAAME